MTCVAVSGAVSYFFHAELGIFYKRFCHLYPVAADVLLEAFLKMALEVTSDVVFRQVKFLAKCLYSQHLRLMDMLLNILQQIKCFVCFFRIGWKDCLIVGKKAAGYQCDEAVQLLLL